MDVSEQQNTNEESKLESSIKNSEEYSQRHEFHSKIVCLWQIPKDIRSEPLSTSFDIKAKNQESFYDKIDEWRKYFNTLETQGPQVF